MAPRTAALSSTIRMQLRCTTDTVIIKLRMVLTQVNTEFVVSNTRKSTSPKNVWSQPRDSGALAEGRQCSTRA